MANLLISILLHKSIPSPVQSVLGCLRQMVLSVVCWRVISSRAEDDVWRREKRIAEHKAVQTGKGGRWSKTEG